jgi:antitoxin (DNA-binding transcriptional repressor) of toxin-antitoxin stability system
MTTTLNQGQAEFPRLVELASQGEDVVIIVDGEPKARLTKATPLAPKPLTSIELRAWMAELDELRARYSTGKSTPTSEQLIEEDRADR